MRLRNWLVRHRGRKTSKDSRAGFNDAAEDSDTMTKSVPYLTDEAIERDVASLLAEYAQARGLVIGPPVPIEDIVEKHLKLGIEFDDTHRLFSVPRTGDDPDIRGCPAFC